MTETDYIRGERAVWCELLRLCLANLGVDDPDLARRHRWVLEREAAVNALLDICEDHGDLDWSRDLYLADIIEKHLGRHLEDVK